MTELETVQQQLRDLAKRSAALQQALDDLQYRHSQEGDRRSGGERRSGRDQRAIGPATPAERAAGRRYSLSDRRQIQEGQYQVLRVQIDTCHQQSKLLEERLSELLRQQAT